jgi:hypothetical protein
MLMTIFFVVLLLWLVAMITAYTLGGLVHLLLLLAVIVLFVKFLEHRSPS